MGLRGKASSGSGHLARKSVDKVLDAFSDRGGEKGWTGAEPFSMKDSGCEECGGGTTSNKQLLSSSEGWLRREGTVSWVTEQGPHFDSAQQCSAVEKASSHTGTRKGPQTGIGH